MSLFHPSVIIPNTYDNIGPERIKLYDVTDKPGHVNNDGASRELARVMSPYEYAKQDIAKFYNHTIPITNATLKIMEGLIHPDFDYIWKKARETKTSPSTNGAVESKHGIISTCFLAEFPGCYDCYC